MSLKKLLGIGALTLFLLSVLCFSALSNDEQDSAKKPCGQILTFEIYDKNVNPVAGHITHFIEQLSSSPDHIVRDRNANLITVETTNARNLLVGNESPILSVTVDGVKIPTYTNPISLDKLPKYRASDAPSDRRQAAYRAMGLLPQGIYELMDPNGKPFSLIVSVSENPGRYQWDNSHGDIEHVLNVDLWPGLEFTPRSESHYKETSIASFSNHSGVADYWGIEFGTSEVKLLYGLPYGLGEDFVTLRYDQDGKLKTVKTPNKSYTVVRLFPIDRQR